MPEHIVEHQKAALGQQGEGPAQGSCPVSIRLMGCVNLVDRLAGLVLALLPT
jgi:hypothetical protein